MITTTNSNVLGVVSRINSPEHERKTWFAAQDQVTAALTKASEAATACTLTLQQDVKILDSAGFGIRSGKLRRELGRCLAREQFFRAAAMDHEGCGRDHVQYECRDGHKSWKPRTCGRAAICPRCARQEAVRRRARYEERIVSALRAAPSTHRLRFVTLSLKPFEAESSNQSFARCQHSFRSAYRIMWGRPKDPAEWIVYFELWPLTDAEIDATPALTRSGRPRKPGARERDARALRREALKVVVRRKDIGAVCGYEHGEKSAKPHVHALVICPYIDTDKLSRCWWLLTGSYMQKVRAADKGAIAETLKYPLKFTARSPAELVELYEALLVYKERDGHTVAAARRRVEAYGSLRSTADDDPWPTVCDTCGYPARAVGVITWALWRLGVRDVPKDERFAPMIRGSPS